MNFLSSNEINQINGGNFTDNKYVRSAMDFYDKESVVAGELAQKAYTIATTQSAETYGKLAGGAVATLIFNNPYRNHGIIVGTALTLIGSVLINGLVAAGGFIGVNGGNS